MVESLNTHHYDGKLFERIDIYRSEFDRIKNMELEIKKQAVEQYKLLFDNETQNNINLILSGNGNYDGSNQLDALDLLYYITTIPSVFDTPEFKKDLGEQIRDISNGPCPPGRATRIFQVIACYYESTVQSSIS